MVTLTKIDIKDIPEVSNTFLMRGSDRPRVNDDTPAKGEKEGHREKDGRRKERDRDGKDTKNRLIIFF